MSPKTNPERVVREIKRRTRKKYSSEEKIRIVLEGLRGEESIAELCRRENSKGDSDTTNDISIFITGRGLSPSTTPTENRIPEIRKSQRLRAKRKPMLLRRGLETTQLRNAERKYLRTRLLQEPPRRTREEPAGEIQALPFVSAPL